MAKVKPEDTLTTEELLATLRNTSLPTVIVEGLDDMIVYRAIEQRLSHLNVSILPTGGRSKLLDIYKRRGEIHTNSALVFIADKDLWIQTGIPPDLTGPNIIWTDGYSIENDAIRDGELTNLLKAGEKEKFNAELVEFLHWYALAVSRHLEDASVPICRHPNHILDAEEKHELTKCAEGEDYPAALYAQISSDPKRIVRGKSLLLLLVRNLSYKGREPKHNDKALLEVAAMKPGPLLSGIIQQVERCITTAALAHNP